MMLNKRGENRYPFLAPDLQGKAFSLSPLVAVEFFFFLVNVLYKDK